MKTPQPCYECGDATFWHCTKCEVPMCEDCGKRSGHKEIVNIDTRERKVPERKNASLFEATPENTKAVAGGRGTIPPSDHPSYYSPTTSSGITVSFTNNSKPTKWRVL